MPLFPARKNRSWSGGLEIDDEVEEEPSAQCRWAGRH